MDRTGAHSCRRLRRIVYAPTGTIAKLLLQPGGRMEEQADRKNE